MNENSTLHCNLCLKSFPDEELLAHLPSAHFPQSELNCSLCNALFSSAKNLHDHYGSEHVIKCGILNILDFAFDEVFSDSDDLIRHTQNAKDWIKKAFSMDSKNVRTKREMRSSILDSFNKKLDVYTEANICDSCRLGIAVCFYCAATFSSICHLKQHLLNAHLQLPDDLKSMVNFCDICCKVFSRNDQLRKHRKCEHNSSTTPMPGWSSSCDSEKNMKIYKPTSNCNYCNKSLANASNLKRHLVNAHSDLMGTPPATKTLFTCHHCKCRFSNKSSIKRHIENLHLKQKETKKSISCFQCDQRFNSIKNLNSHLTAEHLILIQETKMEFSKLDGFWDWKQKEELSTNARFIQLRGLRRQRRKGEEISTLKFVCNRSGIFHSKSNGKRAYRIKGSSKIGRYCSAYMEITFTDSIVECTYCSTHSGHENDLRYLTLSMNEKKEIYEKIQNGATFPSILNEIRDNVGKEIKRKHLVTNKDLHNIVTTFKKRTKSPVEFNEPSSNSSDSCVTTNEIESNYNHDLEINADLWVETCQRIVNQFDPSIPLMQSKYNNVLSKVNQTDAESYTDNDYVRDSTPISPPVEFPTSTSYTPTSNQENEISVQLYSDQVNSLPSAELHVYCVQDTNVEHTACESTENTSKMVNFCANSVALTNLVEHATIIDPILTPESTDLLVENQITSNSPLETLSKTLDDTCNPPDDNQHKSKPSEFLDTNNEMSDLRDRVNSVTALYNIVESELDERKKKLIRNYVDNMFKVLQYRYNKCKSKKKSATKRPRQRPSVTSKDFNRRRCIGRTDNSIKKKILAKTEPKKTTSVVYSCATTYLTSSRQGTYSNVPISSVANTTSEDNISRWQY